MQNVFRIVVSPRPSSRSVPLSTSMHLPSMQNAFRTSVRPSPSARFIRLFIHLPRVYDVFGICVSPTPSTRSSLIHPSLPMHRRSECLHMSLSPLTVSAFIFTPPVTIQWITFVEYLQVPSTYPHPVHYLPTFDTRPVRPRAECL